MFEISPSLKDAIRISTEIILPFVKLIKPIQETLRPIAEMASALSEVSPFRAVKKLGEVQYVYWDYLMPEFVDSILSTRTPRSLNKLLREYNESDNYRTVENIISSCNNYMYIEPYQKIFTQSTNAYQKRNNELAVAGFLIIIIDGLLADISGNKKIVSLFRQMETLVKIVESNESLDENEAALIFLLMTFEKTIEILSTKTDFSRKEPKNLNRHWIMHGRSRRRKTRLDCIKLINLIYGILLLNEYAEQGADENQ